jgi:hypothetical protein
VRVTITASDDEVLREIDDPAVAEFDAISTRAHCPKCGVNPTAVRCPHPVQTSHGSHGDAVCIHCGDVIGTLRVDLSTIFGREEDHAVLFGRPRVYGL